MTLQDDGGLVERLRAGDSAAEQELYLRCQERLRPYLRYRLPDAGETDDCMHEVYVRAVEGLRMGNGPTETLDGWLFGIARNLLKKRYSDRREFVEIPPEAEAPPREIALELEHDGDLPAVPTDLEFVLGKRELWHTVRAAVAGIGAGLRRVISTHIDLSLREQRKISSAELAAALGVTAEQADRQLHRARKATADVVGALVLARTGRSKCQELAGVLDGLLSPEQRNAGRSLVLEQRQASRLLKHVSGCAVCGPQANQAREYARWALGPGLLAYPDDDERRRAVIAFFQQAREGRTWQQSATTVLAAEPVAAAAQEITAAAPQPGRLSTAVVAWMSRYPVLNNIAQAVQENPITLRVAVGAVALVVVIGGLVTASVPEKPTPPVAQAQTDPAGPSGGTPTEPIGTADPRPVAQTYSPTPPAATTVTTAAKPQRGTTTPSPAPAVATTAAPTTTSAPQLTEATTPPSQPPPQPRDIGIDITGTDYLTFGISGAGTWKDARQVQSYRLSRGTHVLLTQPGGRIPFTVTDSWTVEYDRRFDGVVSGRGTSTLVVRGLPVTFDTSGTDYTDTAISGTGWRNIGSIRTLRLLPGPHYVQAPTGSVVRFHITDTGHINYEPTNDHIATGRGTSTLTLRGLPVTFDTSGTDYTDTAISGTGWRNIGSIRTLRLLPGPHYVQAPTGSVVRFHITDTGHINYEPTNDHIATGRGTTTLTLRGLPVTFDRSGVDYTYLVIGGAGPQFGGPTYTLRLLPGAGYVQTPQLNVVRFQVTEAGRLEFDRSYDSWAHGRGMSTLTVRGVEITIDATASTHNSITVSGVPGWKDARLVHVVRLMPGRHQVAALDGRKYGFVVKDNGLIDFEPSLDGVLSGRDGTRLTVRRTSTAPHSTRSTR